MHSNLQKQPFFNAPKLVMFVAGLLLACHVFAHILVRQLDSEAFVAMANFIFYNVWFEAGYALNLDNFWTIRFWLAPIGHALFHADFVHLLTNLGFLLAFSTPIARLLSPIGWLLLLLFSVLAGAYGWAIFAAETDSIIGMSGGVSGMLGALIRPALMPFAHTSYSVPHFPAPFNNKKGALTMLFVFVAMNLTFFLLSLTQSWPMPIAWQAHLFGLVAGFFTFPILYRLTAKD